MNPYQSPASPAETAAHEPASGQDPTRSAGRYLRITSLIAASGFVLWCMLLAIKPTSYLIGFSAWAAAPYLVLWLVSLRLKAFPTQFLLGVALAAATIFGVWMFDQVNKDAQGGLILLFAPGYQLVGVVLVSLVALLVDGIARRSQRKVSQG